MIHLVPCFHYRSCLPPDLPLSPLSPFLICTSVGPRFHEYCAFVRVHRSTCSSHLPLSPSVVLRFHVSRTRYMVSYIACIVIYPVPQSEYRLCSPLRPCSLSFDVPLDTSARLGPPSCRPCQAGSASDSGTVRKPLAMSFDLPF
jgi:hypothetical protein